MRQDEQETATEDWTLGRVSPLITLDELKHEIDVQALLKFHFVLFLDLPDDANQVEECVLDLNCLGRDLPIEVLIKDLLNERVARWIELLEQLFDQMLRKQIQGAIIL